MYFFKAVAALLPFAAAVPVAKRQQALSANDINTLQLAHYLENLEFNLYSGGFSNFTEEQYRAAGFPPGFRDGIGLTAQQENTHRTALAAVLRSAGQAPVPECTYSFPYTDPRSFVALANMITSVGIGAYLGGAALLTDSAPLLTTAASIVTTEARHDTFLRVGLGASPFPTPFDTVLPGELAYTLAHAFVVRCPQEPPNPPFVVLPSLTLTAPPGARLGFAWDSGRFFVKQDPAAQLYVALINQNTAPVFAPVGLAGANQGSVPVPRGVAGVAFAVLTTFPGGLDASQLSSFGTLAIGEVVLS